MSEPAAGAPEIPEDDEDIALRVRYRDYWDTGERLALEELCADIGLDLDDEENE